MNEKSETVWRGVCGPNWEAMEEDVERGIEEEVERNLVRESCGSGRGRGAQRDGEENKRVRVSGFGLKKTGPNTDLDDDDERSSGGLKILATGNTDFHSSVNSIDRLCLLQQSQLHVTFSMKAAKKSVAQSPQCKTVRHRTTLTARAFISLGKFSTVTTVYPIFSVITSIHNLFNK